MSYNVIKQFIFYTKEDYMKIKNLTLYFALTCILSVSAFAQSATSNEVDRNNKDNRNIVTEKVSKTNKVCQANKDNDECGADGASAGVFWREIGGTYTADGYEPEFFSVPAIKENALNVSSEPEAPYYEAIDDTVFNEALRRVKANKKAIKNNFQSELLKVYRQVKAEFELSEHEWIAAETELSEIRSTWDMNASFEKYPFITDPSYRRASDKDQKAISEYYHNTYGPKDPQLW